MAHLVAPAVRHEVRPNREREDDEGGDHQDE